MAEATLTESYQACVELARRTGKNFYYSFLTLPKALAEDMCVLYAFMRWTDDLADEDDLPLGIREVAISQWRITVRDALTRESVDPLPGSSLASHFSALDSTPTRLVDAKILTALADVVRRHQIPSEYLFDVIDGVETDLEAHSYQRFDQLEEYCYHVAGAVGLCCVHIWGFNGPEPRQLAIDCGTAFQLTNILRDLGEDAARGRIYLPQEDLDRFGYTADELRNGVQNPAYRALMQFEVSRAREYFDRSAPLSQALSGPGRRIYAAMRDIYGGLLREIERRGYDVFSKRIRLTKFQKLRSALWAYLWS